MKVIKFGGSSISTVKRIRNVLEIIKSTRAQEEIIVVVSAFGGVTEKLIEMSTMASKGRKGYMQILHDLETFHIDSVKKLIEGENNDTLESIREKFKDLRNILEGLCLIKELSPKALDLIMSIGERLSAFLLAKGLTAQGVEAEYLSACKVIRTDDNFGKANVNYELTNRHIRDYLKSKGAIQVVTGFIASNESNEITTLGRSGSDYTAAIFAAALQCAEIEIWTDVNGVMTADPKIVANAFPIESMTYDEAAEMAHFGSKVIHPKAMLPAHEKGIQLRIRNTFQPDFGGTIIKAKSSANPFIIRGISSISDIALLRVQGSGLLGGIGVSARLFGALAKEKISVILITQGSSEHSICFAVPPDSARKAKKVIETEFSLEIYANLVEKVLIEDNLSVVAVVGEKMRGVPGIAARIFNALGKSGINVIAIAQGSSELNISIVINQSDEFDALNAIHEEFFIKNQTTLHLYLVGIGSVGGKLLEQIQQQRDYLEEQYSVEIKIHGIANSKKMIFDPKGFYLDDWQNQITRTSLAMSIDDFLQKMKEFNFRNSIFVDCTASASIVKSYGEILKSGISIVTPNKKATSSSYAQYRELKNIASRRGVKFFYETNVGASLPIIRTLNDMTLSGDKIIKIEAIISGTISYIFNSFDGTRKFSEIVRAAKQKGYTEPDPREDLNGMDVARKLLILAREVGLQREMSQVNVENILPKSCQKANTTNDFFAALEKEDAYFERLLEEADKCAKKLRYIAVLDGEMTAISLKAIGQDHPFYYLDGNENIISITTMRYNEKPIVIRGPGAGASVTAAGVFADIIRVGNS